MIQIATIQCSCHAGRVPIYVDGQDVYAGPVYGTDGGKCTCAGNDTVSIVEGATPDNLSHVYDGPEWDLIWVEEGNGDD